MLSSSFRASCCSGEYGTSSVHLVTQDGRVRGWPGAQGCAAAHTNGFERIGHDPYSSLYVP
jgi:hypothetical protein